MAIRDVRRVTKQGKGFEVHAGWQGFCHKCDWAGETRQQWVQAVDDAHDHSLEHDQ